MKSCMRTRAIIGKVIFLRIVVNSFAGTKILRVNVMIHSSLSQSIITHKMQTPRHCYAKIGKNTSFCIYILRRFKNTVCVLDCFTKSGISHHPPTLHSYITPCFLFNIFVKSSLHFHREVLFSMCVPWASLQIFFFLNATFMFSSYIIVAMTAGNIRLNLMCPQSDICVCAACTVRQRNLV